LFCGIEFGFGIIINSLALMSDAFHMLSDMISLGIAFAAIQLSRRTHSSSKSYGWIRAEILGGLINGVFLVAVCFFIALEAIQRFISIPVIEDPLIIIIIGSAGLVMNIVGLVLFSAHRGMGGHGHSHGHSHGHGHGHGKVVDDEVEKQFTTTEGKLPGQHKEKEKHSNANLHAIFLHVLGDAVGSLGAIITGLIIMFVPSHYKYFADPCMSILLAVIILKSSVPLVRHCTNILMQSVPEEMELEKITEEMLNLEGVVGIHDLHVWQLSDTKHVATVHITVYSDSDFSQVALKIKQLFHTYGVHSTTVQPEYVEQSIESKNKQYDCNLACEAPSCRKMMCCERTPHTAPTTIE